MRSDADLHSEEQYSKQGKINVLKDLNTALFIAKSLVTSSNKPLFLGQWKKQDFEYAFQMLIVTPTSLRELETSRSNPHKVNGGWGILDKLIGIFCCE